VNDPDAATPDANEPSAADRVFGPDAGDAERAYDEMMAMHEERLAEMRRSSIEAGRRKGGAAGAALAGAMLVVQEIYEGPRQDDKPVTVEAASDPHDVDRDGIDLDVGDVGVSAPPLERRDPIV
jgi:hypothetical protein